MTMYRRIVILGSLLILMVSLTSCGNTPDISFEKEDIVSCYAGNRSVLDINLANEELSSVLNELIALDISDCNQIDDYDARYYSNDYAAITLNTSEETIYYMFYDRDDELVDTYILITDNTAEYSLTEVFPDSSFSGDINTHPIIARYYGTLSKQDVHISYSLAREAASDMIESYNAEDK